MKSETFLILVSILFVILASGSAFNLLAMHNNGGKMPVLCEGEGDEDHFCFSNKEYVKFYYFSDIFLFETKEYRHYFSAGDILIFGCAGAYSIWLLILGGQWIIKVNKKRRRKHGCL